MNGIKRSMLSFPALADSPKVRNLTFVLLYFSQGIPEGITLLAIPAWMAMSGKSTLEIAGYSAAVMIPFSLKILLAPMMERYTYLPMGRRRPWLLFGQLGIFCSLIGLSLVPDPVNNIALITVAALCVHTFIMFQDIATDSLVIDIVPVEQQGKANSLMWGAKSIGASVSLFAGSWLINTYGLSSSVLTMSAATLMVLLLPLSLCERSGERLLPWSKGKAAPESILLTVDSWGKLLTSFKRVVFLKNSLLMLSAIFFIEGALHFMRTLLPIFTIKELGWSNILYSNVYSTASLLGGIIGMLIGGFALQRMGIVRYIQSVLLLVALLGVTMAACLPLWKNIMVVYGFIGAFCTLLTLINIGLLALAMHLCWKRISAVQFTFAMTIFNAGLASGAALLGVLRSLLSWQLLFLAFALLVMVGMTVLQFIRSRKHREQVEMLEKNYLEILKAEGSLLVRSETS